jgi:PIN domain nuclease of toxin-antitoxin system
VRLLLDTHALLWWLTADRRLTKDAQDAIAAQTSYVAVSAASAWEIAIKARLGRLDPPTTLEDQLVREQFHPLPITLAHAIEAGALPLHHDDPFDRMLVAQAQLEGLTIVTRDPRIAAYGVPTLAA